MDLRDAIKRYLMTVTAFIIMALFVVPGFAAVKPNIILLVSDDTDWGDLGAYGGGEGRGMPTPSLDRMAKEGMQFWSFYGQPSCNPGRSAMQTGRIPNRSGMTAVAILAAPKTPA